MMKEPDAALAPSQPSGREIPSEFSSLLLDRKFPELVQVANSYLDSGHGMHEKLGNRTVVKWKGAPLGARMVAVEEMNLT